MLNEYVFCIQSTFRAILICLLLVTMLAFVVTMTHELSFELNQSFRNRFIVTSACGLIACSANLMLVIYNQSFVLLDTISPGLWTLIRLLIVLDLFKTTFYGVHCVNLLIPFNLTYLALRVYYKRLNKTTVANFLAYRDQLISTGVHMNPGPYGS